MIRLNENFSSGGDGESLRIETPTQEMTRKIKEADEKIKKTLAELFDRKDAWSVLDIRQAIVNLILCLRQKEQYYETTNQHDQVVADILLKILRLQSISKKLKDVIIVEESVLDEIKKCFV